MGGKRGSYSASGRVKKQMEEEEEEEAVVAGLVVSVAMVVMSSVSRGGVPIV